MFTAGIDHAEDVDSLDEFAAAWAAHERSHARLALAAARFEAAGDYGIDGAVSQAAWMRDKCRMSDSDASGLLRLGRFLRNHDAVADAAVTGVLSAGQVHAVRVNVPRSTEQVFREHETEIVSIVRPLTVRETEQACKAWRLKAEAITEQNEPVEPERELVCKRAADGSLVGRFVFDPAMASEFEKALGTAGRWEGPSDKRAPGLRQADAMFDVFAFFNANHDRPGTPRHRPHIELSGNIDTIHDDDCGLASVHGDPFPAASSDAFLCDSVIQRFVMSGSTPIDIGRATRTVPLDMFRARAKRDGGCRHPGCDRRVAWCDAHHIRFWRHGGTTSLDNLVLLCAFHHHQLHGPGWHLKLLPSGTVEVTTPEGRTLTSEPRPRDHLRLIRLQT